MLNAKLMPNEASNTKNAIHRPPNCSNDMMQMPPTIAIAYDTINEILPPNFLKTIADVPYATIDENPLTVVLT